MSIIHTSSSAEPGTDIAIIGMAGRFPGARHLEEFWSNLVRGVESISWCSEQEVIDSGFHPQIARDPDFIAAAGKLDGEYMFDAEFFGFAPREAEIMDPQHRIFLECSWEALESAGYNPETFPGRIGIYAGASTNTYFPFHIAANHELLFSVGLLQAIIANDKDFLASRVAYKLNLKGPAISLQTACSTSLVAVSLACQSLLTYQSDMMLAGGVSITPKGRLYRDGFIFSRDGHCRPFDEKSQGAVFGNGMGVVVLKRLEDALDAGDYIYAVIKGTAVNNDGALKAGYTAPSVTGQMEVIAEAQALGGVAPESIGYVEAHGTGTALGDPIEINALTQAFRSGTNRKSCCAIGSVKGNIGHLDAAAGIAGLIKTALILERKQIPPTLHFQKSNPHLGLEKSPFFINTELRDWKEDGSPRRAAVSSFGFGGTNTHVVLEQAPSCIAPEEEDWQLMPVSSRTESGRNAAALKLAEFFESHPEQNLADAAFTLQLGRKHFNKRAFAVVRNQAEAARVFAAGGFPDGDAPEQSPPVIFMFPGQSSQALNMALGIYESEPLFRSVVDHCAQLSSRYLCRNLLDVIYPSREPASEIEALLTRTEYAQPALFAIEYALAKLWQSWGIQPAVMIGHSVGEIVAACLAGVFSLEDGIKLICARGAAMQEQPAGEMLSVMMTEREVGVLLPDDLALAAINAPDLCVVSGPPASIENFQQLLIRMGRPGRRLRVSHAFHSPAMRSAVPRFLAALNGIKFSPQQVPIVSNVTGDWAAPDELSTPEYWVRHMLSPVRFSDGWLRLARNQPAIFLEAGPGQALTALARHCGTVLSLGAKIKVLTSLEGTKMSDRRQLLTTLGRLWLHGNKVHWNALHQGKKRHRVQLPTYQFQRKLYWLPPVHAPGSTESASSAAQPQPVHVASTNQTLSASPAVSLADEAIETVVTNIWREVLGVEEIGLRDDFFTLGGHSLMAIQLIAEIRRKTGAEIPIRALFQEPTVSALAGKIRDFRLSVRAVEKQPIQRISRDGELPLTFHQEDVWEFEAAMPGTARYTGVICLTFKGKLVHVGLESALHEVITRHEVLRTTYARGANGRPVARIHPPQLLRMPVTDISHLDSESQTNELLQSANLLVRTPFDLGRDLPVRVLLFRTGETSHVLLFSSHYIAVDSWTAGCIVKEIGEHYAAFVRARPANAQGKHLQCVDYAHWERSRMSDEEIAPHLSYWRQKLLDVSVQAPLPLDRARPEVNTMRGATFHFALMPDQTRGLKDFSHKRGSTLFFTLLSALNVLFHLRSGSSDIVIGTITGDREHGGEEVFGPLVNCLPLRNRLCPEQTFVEIMENTRNCTTEAYTHQVPFHKIVETAGHGRDLIKNPLFRVTLVLRNVPFTEAMIGGMEIQFTHLELDRSVSEGDLSIYLQDIQGKLSGSFEYNCDIFYQRSIERMAQDLVKLLAEVIVTPEARLCDLEIARNIQAHPQELSYA
jgi:acyl transferase domain-containing protein